jgi:thiamine biosynthesis lipoprotein
LARFEEAGDGEHALLRPTEEDLTMATESGFRRTPTRRDVLRILAVGGAAGVAWKMGLLGRFSRFRPVMRSRTLMGTGVHLNVLGDDLEAAEAAADATLGRMADLEALLSRYRPESELTLLNRAGRLENASSALLDVLHTADRVSRLGDGAFDVTIQPVLDLYRGVAGPSGALPAAERIEEAMERVDHRRVHIDGTTVTLGQTGMRLTLDGVAKGFVIDRGVDTLKDLGFNDVFVEAGGDLVAGGTKAEGLPWRVGIRRPRPGVALQARFEASNRAVATSGDYMQPFTTDYAQHHILDPRTGRSAPDLASSTVSAPNAMLADALATLTMVLGPQRGRDLIEALPDCEAYFVSKNLDVTRTSGFEVA